MNHKGFKEWIYLAVSDELGTGEMCLLEEHMSECQDCRSEFEELNKTLMLMGESGAARPSETMLWEARRELMETLRTEAPMQSIPTQMDRAMASGRFGSTRSRGFDRRWIDWFTGPRLALSGVAAIAVGIVAGYYMFSGPADIVPTATTESDRPLVEFGEHGTASGGPMVSNVRFVETNDRSGELEVQYDLIRPVRLRAGVDDARMQRLLAQALLNERNDGVRLEAIHALEEAPISTVGGSAVKDALLSSVMTDPNPGVRRQALLALQRFPFDTDIKAACLFVLKNDHNPGMRVASIDMLAQATLAGQIPGQEVYDVLKSDLVHDDVLRARSNVFIQEVNDAE